MSVKTISFQIFNLDFSITNFLLINLLALLTFQSFIFYISSHNNYLQESSFYFTPNAWQKTL